MQMSFLWTAVPTLYKKSVRFNHPGLGAVDAKHLELWMAPKTPGCCTSHLEVCHHVSPGRLGRGSTWSGPAHFLRGAHRQGTWGRWGMGGRRSLFGLFWAFLDSGAALHPQLGADSPVLGSVSPPFSWVISGRQ